MGKIKYKSGFKYRLHETYVYKLKNNPNVIIHTQKVSINKQGFLTIQEGFCWDGASGPAWDTKSSMRGGLVHDALYQLLRMGLLRENYRKPADRELRDICIEDGMWKWRARGWYRFVRSLAGGYADPKNLKKIRTAP